MYETYFGLDESPFSLTPDPKYLYLSDVHNEALSHLRYGIEKRMGFVMITGEVGAGKTTICRQLLGALPEDTHTALILHPGLSDIELLQTVNQEFGCPWEIDSKKALLDELYHFLLSVNANNQNAVLIIDEGQNLDPSVLEQIRMLSNLETEKQKLLQILLVGQPELAEMLASPNLRQIEDRIVLRYHMGPLNKKETADYINHRLMVSGSHGEVKFSAAAIRKIYGYSQGYPRKINALADRSLLLAFLRATKRIDGRIVESAKRELRGQYEEVSKRRRSVAPLLSATFVLLLISIAGLWGYANRPQPVQAALSVVPARSEVAEITIDQTAAAPAWIISDFDRSLELLYQQPDGFNGPEQLNLHPGPQSLGMIKRPFIAMSDRGYSVIVGVVDGYVDLVNPQGEMVKIAMAQFQQHYRWNIILNYLKGRQDIIFKLDDRDPLVKDVQAKLRKLGYLSIEPDGVYGIETAKGIERLQEEFGLRRDGIAGPETLTLLDIVGEL